MSRIFIEPIPCQGPKGDRDREVHPYFDYRIHVLKAGEYISDDTVVQSVSGFDKFHTTIRSFSEVMKEVDSFAERLSERMGAEIERGGEGQETFQITINRLILATDEADARQQVEALWRSGDLVPHIFKPRYNRSRPGMVL